MLIKSSDSCLVIVDIQESLTPLVLSPREVINNTVRAIKAADIMKVPVLTAEQYPKGLSNTVIDLRELLEPQKIFAKTTFSAFKNKDFASALKKTAKKQVIISGIEAHICVLQTAFDLKEAGYEVFVILDAISSRNELDLTTAKERMRQNGISLITLDMLIFEWLSDSARVEFKQMREEVIR